MAMVSMWHAMSSLPGMMFFKGTRKRCGCHDFIPEKFRVGLGLGKSFVDQDLSFSGESDLDFPTYTPSQGLH